MGFISILFVTLPDQSAHSFQGVLIFLSVIPFSLLSRFISVWIPLRLLQLYYKMRKRRLHPAIRYAMPLKFVLVLTWSGLRGAISVALALSLSDQLPTRAIIFSLCYILVCFSTIVQGLLFERVVGYLRAFPTITRTTTSFHGNTSQMKGKRKNPYLKESFADKSADLKPLPSLSELIRSVGLVGVALNKEHSLPGNDVTLEIEPQQQHHVSKSRNVSRSTRKNNMDFVSEEWSSPAIMLRPTTMRDHESS